MIPASLRSPPGGKPWLLYGVLGASLLGNAVLGARALGARSDEDVSPVQVAVAPDYPVVGEPGVVSNPPVPAAEVAPLPEPEGVAQAAGTHRFTAEVRSSLSATFQSAEGTSPAALSAVFSRLFVWDVDFRRDIHKGDRVDVLYLQDRGTEPTILAARLVLEPGTPHERELVAARFQAPGDRFPSYWDEAGQEVERRLIAGPVESYEQIATLIKLRPSHEGMDFKTPIGTPVVAPRAGKVTRVDWEAEVNGQCVEVRYSDGVLARFTHLNERAVEPGQSFSAGTQLGASGNTGRSVVAHLHYELERGGKILDPVNYHGTLQRKIQPEAMPRYARELGDLLSQLDGKLAAR